MKRIASVLAIFVTALVMPRPIIAAPSLIVERIDDNTAIVKVDEPVMGIGFEVIGQANVTVNPEFTDGNMPAINKARPTGTLVAVYNRHSQDGVIATIKAGDNWTIANTKGRTADGKFFEPTIRYINPNGFRLAQNYPNPFNPSTEIRYEIDENGPVELAIYNVAGQLVRTLVNETKSAGYHTAKWNATDDSGNRMTSGVYFCRLKHAGASETRRMILLK